jgi:hypothetical protein
MIELETFIGELAQLTLAEVTALAIRIEDHAASAAGELAWWRATVEIERTLRLTRQARSATLAARRAAQAVLGAAAAAGIDLPDSRVTAVARAAAEVARGLVAGGGDQVDELLASWTALEVA